MPYLNHYACIGNLTHPPELRRAATPDQPALCLLNLALNRDRRDEHGAKQTRTTFVNDIEVWGPPGEACAHFLTQGSMVFVEGRMDLEQWQDKKSGARRSRLKLVAENVQFLRIKRPEAPVAMAAEPEPSAPRPARSRRGAQP
jgi:single-strand DNA-binding protein